MIVKNEGPSLDACLRAAAPAVDEVVVVDTGSSDDTLDVARSFGATVESFDFARPDFAGARNASLARATGDWILVLDADERLPEDAGDVRRHCVGGGNVGWVVRRRNLRGGREVLVDHAVRLFRNAKEHRYRGRVHETIDASILRAGGALRRSALAIDHLLPREEGASLDKSRFYLAILEEELAQGPEDVDRLTFQCAELHKLGRMDEAAAVAERIVRIAPGDATNHTNVGLYRMMVHRDARGAELAFRSALAICPGDARARACLSSLPGEAPRGASTP